MYLQNFKVHINASTKYKSRPVQESWAISWFTFLGPVNGLIFKIYFAIWQVNPDLKCKI